MERVFGIDISKYQQGINLTQAKNEGVNFVILRGGYTGYGSGKNMAKDTEFEQHYNNAKKNNLGVGAYFFSRAISYDEGKKEALFLYNNCLIDKQFDYPIYIDVEDPYYQIKAGKNAVTEAIKGFCEILENLGYYVGIYANTNWFNNYIDTSKLNKYDKWVARWGEVKPSNPVGGMWQFGGETNLVRSNKIANMTCDQDYAYYDYPTIIKNKGLNGYGKSNQNKPSTTTSIPVNDNVYIVKKGDTLSKIATLYNTTYQVLANYNNIANPNKIYIGQQIKIPSNNQIATTYIVKKGDTLSAIAKKYNTTYQKIANYNNITDPNKIYPGQTLIIK